MVVLYYCMTEKVLVIYCSDGFRISVEGRLVIEIEDKGQGYRSDGNEKAI